jgi:rhodanese-related sulfurtransferase
MNARKLLLTTLLAMAVVISACGPAATPVPPTAAPTVAPKPTAAPAFDIKAALDKYFSNLPDGFGTIAPAALKDQMAATKVFIVDVREAKEVTDNGFVEGAVNIPIRTLAKNLDKLPAKDQPIVVACGSGHRSAIGMMALQMLGYTNVKSQAGGLGAWKAANLPVATGAPAAPAAGKAPDVDKDLLAALDKYLSGLPDGFGTIAPAALNDQLAAAKPFQLEVREAKEITDNGKIAGSISIPVRTLIKNLDKLPQDKATVIIAECGSGHRSAMAMMALNLLGYTNVKSLAGGFGAWKNANLPIEK